MNLQINVPDRGPLNPIGRVKFTLELSGSPAGGVITFGGTTLNPGLTIVGGDQFIVSETANQVTVDAFFPSDFGVDGLGARDYLNLTGTRPRSLAFVYTEPGGVTVTGSRLSGYCAPSTYNRSNPCRRVDNTPAAWTIAPPGSQNRHALDAIFVLDKSGSMNSNVPGTTGNPRFPVLQSAAQEFIDLWDMEASGVPEDRLALVWFSSTGTLHTGLVQRGAAWGTMHTNIGAETASGNTAMGDGVSKAVQAFDTAAAQNDLSVLIFTDGLQNRPLSGAVCCPPGAGVACQIEPDPAPDTPDPTLLTFCDLVAGERIALANKCMLVQTIGIGAPGTALSDLLNVIAAQTGGNSALTSNAPMDLAFASQLVEIHKGNTMATHKLVQDTIPAGASSASPVSFEFDKTVRQVLVALSWRGVEQEGRLLVEFTGPDGKPVRLPTRRRDFYSISSLSADNQLPPGTYQARVFRNTDDVNTEAALDYNLHFLVVERSFAFSLSFDDGDYNTGQEIILRMAMSENGAPLAGQAGAIRVEVAKPGMSLSNFLHETNVDLPPSEPKDALTIGEQKVNFLLETTDLGQKLTPQAAGLFTPQEIAPGVYEIRFTDTQTPGRYAFRAFINANVAGEQISRIETRETVVRVKEADPNNSEIVLTPGKDAGTYNLSVTLFDKFGNIVGPDRQQFIRVQVAGQNRLVQVFDLKATGVYTGQLRVAAGSNPVVSISLGDQVVTKAPISTLVPGGGCREWIKKILAMFGINI